MSSSGVATLAARQAAPAEIYAAVAEEVARLLLADRGAIVRYEPDDTLTVTAYWRRRNRCTRGDANPP
jgi:GAF domain-containing protein